MDLIKELLLSKHDLDSFAKKIPCMLHINNTSDFGVLYLDPLTKENLGIKRPGYGIKPVMIYKILNKTSKSNINYDDIIKWSDVQ